MGAEKIIVALDQMDLQEIDSFLRHPENHFPMVKIGLELFVQHGPGLVKKIHEQYQKKIFLDLKLHDIPITVAKSIASLKGLPIELLTLHLSGGEQMLLEAVKEARHSLPTCKLLGVSFLTSLEKKDLNDIFGITDMSEAFLRLFTLAHRAGIDGVVSSPLEVPMLKKHFPGLLSVTPGIRFEDEIKSLATQDQKRVATPEDAFQMGADYLVMGRSLTRAANLRARVEELKCINRLSNE